MTPRLKSRRWRRWTVVALCFTGLVFWIVARHRADSLEPDAVSLVGYTRANGERALIALRNPFGYSIYCIAQVFPEKEPHPGAPRLVESRAAGKWSNGFGVGNNCQPGPHETGMMSVPTYRGKGTDVVVSYTRDLHPLAEGYNHMMAWFNQRQSLLQVQLVDPVVRTITVNIAAR